MITVIQFASPVAAFGLGIAAHIWWGSHPDPFEQSIRDHQRRNQLLGGGR